MIDSQEPLNDFVRGLIKEGEEVLSTAFEVRTSSFSTDHFVNLQQFQKWRTSCKLLLQQLGQFAEPWSPNLGSEKVTNNRSSCNATLGALQSIGENLAAGRLARFEDLVFAEAFSNLIEQAEYLLSKDYFLAAGVLFRAVLEEKLRRLCDAHNESPTKARPTISDFNQSLYKAKVYDKIAFKSVDSMAAVGNEAAHNSPDLEVSDVRRLHSNLIDFLQRH
ncbi:MAG: hypothetical protein AAGD11_00345 [Planctomycetota bacterium]